MIDKMYSLDEIALIPKSLSSVKSRKTVNPFYTEVVTSGIVTKPVNKLPVFIAPMTCLVNKSNFDSLTESLFIPILPVSTKDGTFGGLWDDGRWTALTVNQFKIWFVDRQASKDCLYRILIDCADGHMEDLYLYVKQAKEYYGSSLITMVGNIATPETYLDCCKAQVDYVRIGIGGGSGCTTSVQTGFHTSIPWVLSGIKALKKKHYTTGEKGQLQTILPFADYIKFCKGTITKVVADGGINTIDRAIKCLALGADYVMIGKLFSQTDEACGKVRHYDINGTCYSHISNANEVPGYSHSERHYYGQSSKQGQLDRFGEVRSNPEGTEIFVPITFSLQELSDKFEAALRTAMSYAGVFSLEEFIGNVNYGIQSMQEFNLYNK